MRRSYNQSLIRVAGCSRLFLHRLAHPEKVGSQSLLANLGTGLHSFARDYQRHCLDLKVQSDVAVARSIAARNLVGSGLDAGHYDDLLDLAEKFAEQEHIVADRETYFEQMLTAGQTTTVPPWSPRYYGTPDKVVVLDRDGDKVTAIEIDDYKSGWKVMSHDECRKDLQGWFYAGLWLARHPSILRVRVCYKYLRRAIDRVFEVEADQVRAFWADLECLTDRLDEVVDPKPVAGQLCGFCEIATTCPLVEQGRVHALVDPAKARAAAAFLAALRGAERETSARLRDWVAVNGPIRLPDGTVLGYHQTNKRTYPAPEVLGWAAKNTGLAAAEIMSFFKIGKTEVTGLAKKAGLDKLRKKELMALAWQVPGTKFCFKKMGPPLPGAPALPVQGEKETTP